MGTKNKSGNNHMDFPAGIEVVKMPKIKTSRAAAKRFRKTGSGKIRINHPNASHILTKKTTKRKRRLRKSKIANSVDTRKIKRLCPYLK